MTPEQLELTGQALVLEHQRAIMELERMRDELLEMLTRPKRLGLTDKDAWAEELDNLVQRIEKEVNDGDTL